MSQFEKKILKAFTLDLKAFEGILKAFTLDLKAF